MADVNVFELAAKKKFRFPYKGQITAEDLYDLSVQELDKIFKSLNAQVKASKEESLLDVKSAEDVILDAKIAIIKHIVTEKQEEFKARAEAAEKKARNQRIKEIIASKKDAALQDMSIEQLEAMLSE